MVVMVDIGCIVEILLVFGMWWMPKSEGDSFCMFGLDCCVGIGGLIVDNELDSELVVHLI